MKALKPMPFQFKPWLLFNFKTLAILFVLLHLTHTRDRVYAQVEKISSPGAALVYYRLRSLALKEKCDPIWVEVTKRGPTGEYIYDQYVKKRLNVSTALAAEIKIDPLKHTEIICLKFRIHAFTAYVERDKYEWFLPDAKVYRMRESYPLTGILTGIELDGKKLTKQENLFSPVHLEDQQLNEFVYKIDRELLEKMSNAVNLKFEFNTTKGMIELLFNDIRKLKLLNEMAKTDVFWPYCQPGYEKLPPLSTIKTNTDESNPKLKLAIRSENFRFFDKNITRLALSHNGKWAVSGCWDSTLTIWDVKSQEHTITTSPEAGLVIRTAFDPTDKCVASLGLFEKYVKLWDISNGKLVYTLKGHTGPVNNFSFSPDGELIATASNDKTIKIWDVNTGELLRELSGHSDYVKDVKFIDSITIVSGSRDKSIRIWNIDQGREIVSLKGITESIEKIVLSPGRNLLAATTSNSHVLLCNLENKELIADCGSHSKDIRDLVFSPDGILLATAGEDKTIKVWDTGKAALLFNLKGHKELINALAFSKDGKYLGSASYDKSIKIWNISDGSLFLTLLGHLDSVTSFLFCDEDDLVLSGSFDKSIRWWKLPLIR